jgi:hypothetical protein
VRSASRAAPSSRMDDLAAADLLEWRRRRGCAVVVGCQALRGRLRREPAQIE